MDNSILKELFGNYLKACEILGITELTDKVKAALEKLPPFKRGKGGQLQEWFLDYPEVDVHHRHVSQLYGLYPGNLIHREDEELWLPAVWHWTEEGTREPAGAWHGRRVYGRGSEMESVR